MNFKNRLIALLEENRGNYISGEEIAEIFNVSRTAVWKMINGLKEEGYVIDAVKNKGYSLSVRSDVLSVEGIKHYLDNKDKPIYVYQEIESTNNTLKKLAAEENAPEGTCIISDYQTRGKGRLGRQFFSPKGSGLYLSFLLRPAGAVSDNLKLTAQAAVAVYRAVKKVLDIDLDIKWVNDLYYQKKKVCGILSEGQTSMEAGKLEFVVVGIGINLYEPENGFPEDIRDKAGTILGKRDQNNSFDRNMLAAELIETFYETIKENELSPEYIERNIIPGKEIVVIDGTEQRMAEALAILPDGRLQIREKDGSIKALVFGEVSVKLS